MQHNVQSRLGFYTVQFIVAMIHKHQILGHMQYSTAFIIHNTS